jgi:hypothetical protein
MFINTNNLASWLISGVTFIRYDESKKKITYNQMIMISVFVIALLTSTTHEVRRNPSIRLKGGN